MVPHQDVSTSRQKWVQICPFQQYIGNHNVRGLETCFVRHVMHQTRQTPHNSPQLTTHQKIRHQSNNVPYIETKYWTHLNWIHRPYQLMRRLTASLVVYTSLISHLQIWQRSRLTMDLVTAYKPSTVINNNQYSYFRNNRISFHRSESWSLNCSKSPLLFWKMLYSIFLSTYGTLFWFSNFIIHFQFLVS